MLIKILASILYMYYTYNEVNGIFDTYKMVYLGQISLFLAISELLLDPIISVQICLTRYIPLWLA